MPALLGLPACRPDVRRGGSVCPPRCFGGTGYDSMATAASAMSSTHHPPHSGRYASRRQGAGLPTWSPFILVAVAHAPSVRYTMRQV